MGKRRTNQSGFGTTEVLLTVAAVLVIAVAGLLVYQYHKSGTTKKAATSSSQPTSKPKSSTTTQPAVTATQYLTITEWGVRAPYSGSLKLSYTMSSDGRTATFSSDQLTALSSDCTGKGGAIIRWASTDQVSEGPANANTPIATNYFAGKDPSTYAHIGNYYYTFAHAQSACGDLNTTAATQSQTNDAVKALVPIIQATPN